MPNDEIDYTGMKEARKQLLELEEVESRIHNKFLTERESGKELIF